VANNKGLCGATPRADLACPLEESAHSLVRHRPPRGVHRTGGDAQLPMEDLARKQIRLSWAGDAAKRVPGRPSKRPSIPRYAAVERVLVGAPEESRDAPGGWRSVGAWAAGTSNDAGVPEGERDCVLHHHAARLVCGPAAGEFIVKTTRFTRLRRPGTEPFIGAVRAVVR